MAMDRVKSQAVDIQKTAKIWLLFPAKKYDTLWLFNSLPWKITIFKFGKPSISMGHLYHGYVK